MQKHVAFLYCRLLFSRLRLMFRSDLILLALAFCAHDDAYRRDSSAVIVVAAAIAGVRRRRIGIVVAKLGTPREGRRRH